MNISMVTPTIVEKLLTTKFYDRNNLNFIDSGYKYYDKLVIQRQC